MKLNDIIEKLNLEIRTKTEELDAEVTRGYVSDLLSDVMANSREGDLWVTLQIHRNIVAVAVMKGLAGIVTVTGREPEEDTIKKAEEERLPIMVSRMPAFEIVGRLYALGISGM